MRKRRTDGQRGRGRAEKTNAECDGARAKCKCAAAVRVANYEFKGKIIALGGWRDGAAGRGGGGGRLRLFGGARLT